jgi:putative membrane protein
LIKNYADHSANERTFLAWVRTAIAVVGFGLGAARIGNAPVDVWSEIMLLGSGGLVTLLAYLRMRMVRKRIHNAGNQDDDSLPIDTLMLLLILALFVMLGVFTWHTIR